MRKLKLLSMCLALFDGEGGMSGGAVSASGEAGTEGQTVESKTARQTQRPGSGRRGKMGELGNVVYGRQTEKTQTGSTAPNAPKAPPSGSPDSEEGLETQEPKRKLTDKERRAKFWELVNGEYRDIYTQEFQGALEKRFKNIDDNSKQLEQVRPILDTLAARYKIADGDLDKISAALEDDNAYLTSAAEEAGMSVEQFKVVEKLRRENEQLRRVQAKARQDQQMQQQLQRWSQEAEGLKEVYPEFNLAQECQNPQFVGMLKAGIPVRQAYEVAHLDDIKSNVEQRAAQQTEKQVVANIRAKGSRPMENGVSSQSGITIKSDVSKLTAKDRAEIARRVARGERITF